jgi:hypothetical protein
MGGDTGWFAFAPAPARQVPADAAPELADVGRLARRAVRSVVRAARKEDDESGLSALINDHLGAGADPALPVVQESWAAYDHVNVQAGLDAWLAEPGRAHDLVGIIGYQHQMFGLSELMQGSELYGVRPGNVARASLPTGPEGETLACVRCAVYLVSDHRGPTVLLVRGPDRETGHSSTTVEIAATEARHATVTAGAIRRAALEHNVYRGHVLSFGGEMFGNGGTMLSFHRRPTLGADELILPDGVLDAVQRQLVLVAQHKQRLLASGQHLKRGLLLYGPPGVGKTHTVRYLTGALTGSTVIQLTGNATHMIAEACSVARALQPTMLIVEDVDLIAEDRGEYPGQHPLLFQLLNEMDGLAEDADVAFVLTTNRADLLEPALAARPGRVDQAVELTLPDAVARRRLFELYQGRLDVDTSRLDAVVERTAGVTASFLKELLRRAALVATTHLPPTDDGTAPLTVSADDLDAALDELLDSRNAMTRLLLGGSQTTDGD